VADLARNAAGNQSWLPNEASQFVGVRERRGCAFGALLSPHGGNDDWMTGGRKRDATFDYRRHLEMDRAYVVANR
jgi:hypothetical protein